MSLTLVFSLTCYSVTQLELTKRIKEMDSKNTTPSQKNLVVLRHQEIIASWCILCIK